ncbi:MAG: hypothetical protein ABI402_13265 [Ferruginibacter sp.]
MSSFCSRFLIVSLLLSHFHVYSQDKIYFNSGSITCKIIDITPAIVTYLPLKSSKSVPVLVNTTQLLFNDKGVYINPSKMDFSFKKNQELIKKFLLHDSTGLKTDYIYKTDNNVINGTIDKSKEDKNFVYLENDGTKIEKKSIVAIIYKNGHHQIIGPVSRAADVLWAAYENDFKSGRVANTIATKDSVPAIYTKTAMARERKEITAQNDITKKDTSAKSEMPLRIRDVSKSSSFDLPPLRKQEFEQKANEKVTQLTNFFKIILTKGEGSELINQAIDQALSLFVNTEATVEVSSLNKDVVSYKIKEYLSHIKIIKYERIEVTWRNVQYVSDLHKRPDGNYSGTITFEQEFKGYRDGQIVYSDVTLKKAIVILKAYEKLVDGKAEELWDVLLGDIGVESTRSL